jgi:pilus assembly protein CpaC
MEQNTTATHKRKSLHLFHLLFLCLTISFASLGFAQDDGSDNSFIEESSASSQPKRPRKFINLTLGIEHEEKLTKMPDFITFKGDFKKIVTASYSKEINVLRLMPVREGVASLTIHDRTGRAIAEFRLDVKKSKLDAVVREMQTLLGDIEGIQIKVVNNRVLVDGQVLLPRDLNRIYAVVAQFSDQADTLVTLSPLAQKKIAEFIARDINNPEIEVRAVNDKFVLQGWAGSQDEKDRAEIIAKTYVPALHMEVAVEQGKVKPPKPANDGVINLIQIKAGAPPPPPKIIQLVLHYVELKKDYAKGFNFQFTPAIADGSSLSFQSGSEGAGGLTSTISGTINNLLPKLNWAKNHGHARVLESSSLIVQDGRKGTINAGSSIPIKNTTEQGQSTQLVDIGLFSAITPTILGERSDSINLDISFEIKALTGNTSEGPLISKNTINTAITVRSGQSAAIGGLIRSGASTVYNDPRRVPNNPIISLYASKDFQRNQSQFVVFVTPIIKSSASSGSEKIKKKFRLRD